jgi:hypothetical protein
MNMIDQIVLSDSDVKGAIIMFVKDRRGISVKPEDIQLEKHEPHPTCQAGTPASFTATVYIISDQ